MKHAIYICLILITVFSKLQAQSNDKILTTVAGILTISNNKLFLNNMEIPLQEDDRKGSLSINSNFITLSNEDVILLQSTFASAAFYLIVVINKNDYWVSDFFGTGSDLPEINWDNNKLVLLFPKLHEIGYRTYIYQDLQLR